MAFQMAQKVLFKHCDPAGIVFYPRYFEMMNDCVEAFFDQVVSMPFEELHHVSGGIPTAQIETRFTAPSRHGDPLVLRLVVSAVGSSSAQYVMTAHCRGEMRFETTATLVYVNKAGRPTRWPEEVREKLNACREEAP